MNYLLDLMHALQNSKAALIVQDSDWMFPALETIHVLALTMVFGSIAMVDLRLLGWFSRHRPVEHVTDEALPWTWVAFLFAVFSGTLLFISKAVAYYENWPFRFKLLLLALAGVNMLYFHFTAYRTVASWPDGSTPRSARVAAGLSLLLWVAVVTLGRWIGFTTK